MKLKEEMVAMKQLLTQMEGTVTPFPGDLNPGGATRAGSDPYLSEEMLLAEENVEYVNARPFSYIPGLEDMELSVPVPRTFRGDKSGEFAQAKYRRLENLVASHEAYQGALKGGRPHGKGSWTDPATGDQYDGEWLEGLYHGMGTLIKRNGIVYQGAFQQGVKHGQGVLHWYVRTYARTHVCTHARTHARTHMG